MEPNELSQPRHLRVVSGRAAVQPLNDRRHVAKYLSNCVYVNVMKPTIAYISEPSIIMTIVKIFSESVVALMFPKPMDVIVLSVK